MTSLWDRVASAQVTNTKGERLLCGFHVLRIVEARLLKPRSGGATAAIVDYELLASNNPQMNKALTYSSYFDSGNQDVFAGQTKTFMCAVLGIDKNTEQGKATIAQYDAEVRWLTYMQWGFGTEQQQVNNLVDYVIAVYIVPKLNRDKTNYYRKEEWLVAPPESEYPVPDPNTVIPDIPLKPGQQPAQAQPAAPPQGYAQQPAYPPAAAPYPPAAAPYPPAAAPPPQPPAAAPYPPAAPPPGWPQQ